MAELEQLRSLLYENVCLLMQVDGPLEVSSLEPLRVLYLNSTKDDESLKTSKGSQLADILWLLEMTVTEDGGRQRLAQLVALMAVEGFVSTEVLCSRLEPETLELAHIIPSATIFQKRQIRINTAMLYKQQKFNLLREEPEGYSKLIHLLMHGEDCEALFQNVVSLVGYFDLDPNRVLDLTTDIFAQRINVPGKHVVYEGLLKLLNFPLSTVANVIGFKLAHLAKDERAQEILPCVMLMVARLIKIGLCTLEGIFPHLSPSEDETAKELDVLVQRIQSHSGRPAGVALVTPAVGAKESAAQIIAMDHQLVVTNVGQELQRILDPTVNQRCLLLVGLLKVGEFQKARIILDRFPAMSMIPRVAREIARLLHVIVEPFLEPRKGRPPIKPFYLDGFLGVEEEDFDSLYHTTDVKKFMQLLLGWLHYLGTGLYTDPVLITKLCRVGKKHYAELCKEWHLIIVKHLLPASTLLFSNPAIVHELWDLVKLLPYRQRYRIYSYWRDDLYERSAELRMAKAMVLTDIRRIMRRLTKENVRQYGRLIAKIAHSNPIIVFPAILDQLQAYDNLIQPVVDCLKYLTPLGFDVLTFALIKCLEDPTKERLKDDGTHISTWLQGLAQFTGSLFRKYHSIADSEGVFEYIARQLSDENLLDLVVLSELIYRMGGVEAAGNLTDSHIEAMSGGPVLLAEVIQQSVSASGTLLKPNKRANSKMIQMLAHSHLAIPMWVLLAQQRKVSVFKTDYSQVKLLGTLVDTSHTVFLQYTQLLSNALKEGVLGEALELPTMERLIGEHRVDVDLACSIHRTWHRALGRHWETLRWPADVEEDMDGGRALSKSLLELFWFMELADIHCPTQLYSSEVLHLKAAISSAASVNSSEGVSKGKKEREKAPQAIAYLEAECEAQRKTVEENMEKFAALKDSLFTTGGGGELMTAFTFKCILPRSLMSPTDALFTAAFVSLLHDKGALGFGLKIFAESLVAQLEGILAMLTEFEVHNFARFFERLMAQLHRLYHDPEAFVKGAEGEGFEEYRHWYYAFNGRLFKVILNALSAGPQAYLPIKNSIIVLTRLGAGFPTLRKHGIALSRGVRKLRDGESREDLKVMAARYSAMLSLSESRWVLEEEFHFVPESERTGKEHGEIAEPPPAGTLTPLSSPSRKRRAEEQEGVGEERVERHCRASRGARNRLTEEGQVVSPDGPYLSEEPPAKRITLETQDSRSSSYPRGGNGGGNGSSRREEKVQRQDELYQQSLREPRSSTSRHGGTDRESQPGSRTERDWEDRAPSDARMRDDRTNNDGHPGERDSLQVRQVRSVRPVRETSGRGERLEREERDRERDRERVRERERERERDRRPSRRR